MPKADKAVESSEVSESITFKHDQKILELLQVDREHCDFQTEALALTAYDLRVHPLKPRAKAPILKGWQRKATTDPNLIEQWGVTYPNANVGVVTGASSGVIVIDMDLRNGAMASVQDLERKYGELPLSWSVLTPGGSHLYLRHPGGVVRNCELAPGIDIRGDGGNVAAPGSIHPNGLSYQWRPFCVPGVVDLAEPPEWLLNLLIRKRKWTLSGEIRPKMYQVDLLGPLLFDELESGKSSSLTGTQIRDLYSQESVIKKILSFLGLGEVGIGEKFCCILHEEGHASAAIMPPREPGDPYLYMDFHERESRLGFPLPFVYYRLKGGDEAKKVKRLQGPSFLVWSLRLLRDAGVIGGVNIDAPRLPEGVKPEIRKVYEGFQDLLSLKFLVEEEASPYTWGFIQTWVGLSKRKVESALKWLLSKGFIRFVKWFGEVGSGSEMMLYLLGTRQLIRRRGDALMVQGGLSEVVKSVGVDLEAIERENSKEEEEKQASKHCGKCGEIRVWFTFGDFLACGHCYQPIDTG